MVIFPTCNHPCRHLARSFVGASFGWHHLIETATRTCGRGHICQSPHTMHNICRCVHHLANGHLPQHIIIPAVLWRVPSSEHYQDCSIQSLLYCCISHEWSRSYSDLKEIMPIFIILGMWKLCLISYLVAQFQNENKITQQSTSVEEDHWTVIMWVSFQTFLPHSIIATTPLLFL